MIDSEIISNRCNHIWLCNHTLDGETLQLQNGGFPSDVAQTYTSSATMFVAFTFHSLDGDTEVTPSVTSHH